MMRRRPPLLQPLRLTAWFIASIIANSAIATNLIINGGFELSSGSSGIEPWVIESGSVDITGTETWQPAEGQRSIDLSGNEAGSIYQDVATSPGQAYKIRFAYAGSFVPDPPQKRFLVFWDGIELDDLTFAAFPGQSASNMGWLYTELTASATTPSTRLRFQSLTNTSFGPALDDISVVALVPEPSWGALLLAWGGLVVWPHRRCRKTTASVLRPTIDNE